MNSSIFSSENFRGYARLPAREKRWHLLLAICSVGVYVLCCGILAAVYPYAGIGQRSYQTAAVAALSDKTQVLFLGSSHVGRGIRPRRFSMNVMSLTCTALDYCCCERLVQKHLQRVPGLKVAVLEFDDVPLLIRALDFDHRPLLDLGLDSREFPAENLLVQAECWRDWALSPLLNRPRLTPQGWLRYRGEMKQLKTQRSALEAGFFGKPIPGNPRATAPLRIKQLVRYFYGDGSRNLASLLRTIAYLRRRGITVVLLRLPHHESYWSHRPAFFRRKFDEMSYSVRVRYGRDPGVMIWDMGYARDFSDIDYRDCDHLDIYGADKLSALLDKKLRKLMNSRAR